MHIWVAFSWFSEKSKPIMAWKHLAWLRDFNSVRVSLVKHELRKLAAILNQGFEYTLFRFQSIVTKLKMVAFWQKKYRSLRSGL